MVAALAGPCAVATALRVMQELAKTGDPEQAVAHVRGGALRSALVRAIRATEPEALEASA